MKDFRIFITIIPIILHNLEIMLSLFFELTYVTDLGGTFLPPTPGSCKVVTKLRLKDGETGIINGLTRRTSIEGADGIPISSSLSFLNEVLSSRNRTKERTDSLLSITLYILMMHEINRSDLVLYFIGIDHRFKLKKWKKNKDFSIQEEK